MKTLAVILNWPCFLFFGAYFFYSGIHERHPSGLILVIPFVAALAALKFSRKTWLAVTAFVINVFLLLVGVVFVTFSFVQGMSSQPAIWAMSLALTLVPLASTVALWPLFTVKRVAG